MFIKQCSIMYERKHFLTVCLKFDKFVKKKALRHTNVHRKSNITLNGLNSCFNVSQRWSL